MTQPRFSAQAWQREHRQDWARWTSGRDGERTQRLERLADAVETLVRRWVASNDDAVGVVRQLVPTLGRCNELDFSTQSETLAYTIWHLVDRYARVLQALDTLIDGGHLPLRKTRLSTLEIGAGPSPALQAVHDFYYDLLAWNNSLTEPLELTPVTHLYSLDRGAAWSQLVHAVSEELVLIGDDGPHTFSITYSDFDSFSVRHQHRESVEALTSWLRGEADDWDEYLDPASAREQALATHNYAPGAMDLVILSNFLTEVEMTREFADELALLAKSLTPGGVLMILGSNDQSYDQIFDAFRELVTATGAVRPVIDTSL